MTPHVNRRRSTRFRAVANAAVIQVENDAGTTLIGGDLINISTLGACLRMHERPDSKAMLSIRLEYPVTTPWVEAKVIWTAENGKVGAQFTHRCNRTFYWTATRGQDFQLAHLRSLPSDEFSRDDSTVPGLTGSVY